MVREFATEIFDEVFHRKKHELPISEINGLVAFKLLSEMSLRTRSERKISEEIFKAYGFDFNFFSQAMRAQERFNSSGIIKDRLTKKQINLVAEAVTKQGITLFMSKIPTIAEQKQGLIFFNTNDAQNDPVFFKKKGNEIYVGVFLSIEPDLSEGWQRLQNPKQFLINHGYPSSLTSYNNPKALGCSYLMELNYKCVL